MASITCCSSRLRKNCRKNSQKRDRESTFLVNSSFLTYLFPKCLCLLYAPTFTLLLKHYTSNSLRVCLLYSLITTKARFHQETRSPAIGDILHCFASSGHSMRPQSPASLTSYDNRSTHSRYTGCRDQLAASPNIDFVAAPDSFRGALVPRVLSFRKGSNLQIPMFRHRFAIGLERRCATRGCPPDQRPSHSV